MTPNWGRQLTCWRTELLLSKTSWSLSKTWVKSCTWYVIRRCNNAVWGRNFSGKDLGVLVVNSLNFRQQCAPAAKKSNHVLDRMRKNGTSRSGGCSLLWQLWDHNCSTAPSFGLSITGVTLTDWMGSNGGPLGRSWSQSTWCMRRGWESWASLAWRRDSSGGSYCCLQLPNGRV